MDDDDASISSEDEHDFGKSLSDGDFEDCDVDEMTGNIEMNA